MTKLKRQKYIWFVYQWDKFDCVSFTLRHAKEMAVADHNREPFKIERWAHKNNKYQFDKKVLNK